MKVVDVADEFGLTTAEAIDACLWAGVPADGAATELTLEEATIVRDLITGWVEAGFVPWAAESAASGVAVVAPAGQRSASGPSAPAPPHAEPPGPVATEPGPVTTRSTADVDANDAGDEFETRASRLRRRQPGADGLAARAREAASRRSPERRPEPEAPQPPGEVELPDPVEGARSSGPSLPTRRGGATAVAAGAGPPATVAANVGAAAASTDAPVDPRPSPPPRPDPPIAEASPAVEAEPEGDTAADRSARDAAAAPDDDFGPSGPGTEIVGSPSVQTLSPRLPPAQGGPTGWLPGGPDAKPHLAPLALIALALAIASLVIPFVPAVIAIVLASVTKDRIERSRGWLTGKPLATMAQVVAGIGVGLWLVLIVGSIVIQDRDNTDHTPDLQVAAGTVQYGDIEPGSCVRLPRTGDINQWSRVECGAPHQAEVFGSLTAGNSVNQSYPGGGPIEATAKEDCRRKLTAYAGTGTDVARLEVGYSYPTAQTWKAEDDRTIWCVAFRNDGALLSGTLKLPSTIPDASPG